MNSIFDSKAPTIDLRAMPESAPARQVSAHQRELWGQRNRDAIEAYNELVASHGSLADELRIF